MKYKVGDKVKIVSERAIGMCSEGSMDKYLSTVMTISAANEKWGMPYEMEEDGGAWSWDDDMIEGLAEEVDKEPIKETSVIDDPVCQKPELGLKPKYVHDQQRFWEIIDAMERQGRENDHLIPKEWYRELASLADYMSYDKP